jgi:hypothetical protein
MTAERLALPLVLRRERFGGILFDPFDGTHLELDPSGFELIRDWLTQGREPATPEERDFLASVRREMPTVHAGSRPVRERIESPSVAALAARAPTAALAPTALLSPLAPTQHATVLASPTLVDLQITRRCTMACPQCYASSELAGTHMAFDDVARLLRELAEAGICQIAIGGGEPLLHPDIVAILELGRSLGLVPNLTTNGLGSRLSSSPPWRVAAGQSP